MCNFPSCQEKSLHKVGIYTSNGIIEKKYCLEHALNGVEYLPEGVFVYLKPIKQYRPVVRPVVQGG